MSSVQDMECVNPALAALNQCSLTKFVDHELLSQQLCHFVLLIFFACLVACSTHVPHYTLLPPRHDHDVFKTFASKIERAC